jgi:uncharacterized membrane protein YeaQ/YmgE (transglycosylase-associated protein family)
MDGLFNFIGELVKAPFVCIGWVVLGIIAGSLARRIMGGRGNLIADLILGIAGAVFGGFALGAFNLVSFNTGGLQLYCINFVVATIGAIGLIAIGRALGMGGKR